MFVLSQAMLYSALCASGALAPPADSVNWKAVDSLVGRPSVVQPGDVHRFNFPRSDLHVTVAGVPIKPAFALGGWVAMKAVAGGVVDGGSVGGGAVVETYIGELRRVVEAVNATNDPAFGWTGTRLEDAVECLARTTAWLLAQLEKNPQEALAGATPYLRLFAVAGGGCLLAQQALAALRLSGDAAPRIALARFFAENFAVQAGALERTVVEGAGGVIGADAALAS